MADLAMSRRRWSNGRSDAAAVFAGKSDLKLHLGCGRRAMAGWINIDAEDGPGVDLRWDLRDRLPCAEGVAALVYSEHVLEHLEFEDAIPLLAEIHRVLAPGGRLRLGVPDAERYLRAYASGDERFFHALRHIGSPSLPLDTPIKVINQMFRMGGAHCFAWDFETLSRHLTEAGFVDVERFDSGRSSLAALCLDDPEHAPETLYVEARRSE